MQISQFETSHKQHQSTDTLLQFFEARHQLLNLLNQKTLSARDPYCKKLYVEKDKPNRLLARVRHAKNCMTSIPKIKHSDGRITPHTEEIIEMLGTFYKIIFIISPLPHQMTYV